MSIKLINFYNMNLDEKKLVLNMRNNMLVKQWMFNNTEIIFENHLKFIETLKYKKDKQYFLVKQDNKYIGVIDFTQIDYEKKECYFGLYVNPFEKIVGMGTILMKEIIKYGFKNLKLRKLNAEVFSNNIKAINLYKKFKFKTVNKIIINGKEIICMELKNENR